MPNETYRRLRYEPTSLVILITVSDPSALLSNLDNIILAFFIFGVNPQKR